MILNLQNYHLLTFRKVEVQYQSFPNVYIIKDLQYEGTDDGHDDISSLQGLIWHSMDYVMNKCDSKIDAGINLRQWVWV